MQAKLEETTRSVLDSMHWDADLNAYREVDGKVMGAKCGLLIVDGEEGDVIYRLISATFVDEIAAQGRHTITVDVIDENGRRLDGTIVEHGWPWNKWPAADEIVEATVFGAQLAEWGIWEGYNPGQVECGPYWVRVKGGASDVFYGPGLPGKHHVCFVAVFQKLTVGGTGGGGTVNLDLAAIKADTEAILGKLAQVFK